MNLQTLLRWTVTAVLGGAGLHLLGYSAWHIWASPQAHWSSAVITIVLALLMAAPLLLAAYWTMLRDYELLCALSCGLGAFILFAIAVRVIAKFGLPQRPGTDLSGWELARFCVALVCFPYAFRLSMWFNERSFKFLLRYIKVAPSWPNSPIPRNP